jgi:oligopeptide/dipeptide ABC transporter ATP-binding protein
MLSPRLIVLDEPVSALDISTQADILNLLERLQDELGIAYLHIGHNPALVAHASRRMGVMYLGKVVEIGPAREVYTRPKHPYTEALLSAIPVADPRRQRSRRRIILRGEMPSAMAPPQGCRFQTRCPHVMDICRRVEPPAFVTPDGSSVKCHLHEEGPRLQGESVSVLRRQD